MAWLAQYGIAVLPVLTKADKLSKTNQKKQRLAIASALNMDSDRLILFSAKTNQGKGALWEQIGIALDFAAASGVSNRKRIKAAKVSLK
jgi:GTP-binding protein